MNSLVTRAISPACHIIRRQGLKTSACYLDSHKSLANFDPNNYSVPIRPATMDDLMEPYGSWKTAYERECRTGNKRIIIGTVTFAATLIFFYYSGVVDPLFMPNLDNIMEDTEPFNFDKEGRVTV